MDLNEIFLHYAEVIRLSLLEINDWKRAGIKIKRLKGNAGFHFFYKIDDSEKEFSVDATATLETFKLTQELHRITQNNELKHKKWNRAIFTITPNNEFEIEYIWDQQLQNDVDEINNRKVT